MEGNFFHSFYHARIVNSFHNFMACVICVCDNDCWSFPQQITAMILNEWYKRAQQRSTTTTKKKNNSIKNSVWLLIHIDYVGESFTVNIFSPLNLILSLPLFQTHIIFKFHWCDNVSLDRWIDGICGCWSHFSHDHTIYMGSSVRLSIIHDEFYWWIYCV